MKKYIFIVSAVVLALLTSCDSKEWPTDELTYTDVYSIKGISGIDSLDVYIGRDYAIGYKGSTLTLYDMPSYNGAVSMETMKCSLQFNIVRPASYAFTMEDGTVKKLDLTEKYTTDADIVDTNSAVNGGKLGYGAVAKDAPCVVEGTIVSPVTGQEETVSNTSVTVSINLRQRFTNR